ncbi:MAG: hypothetical protein DMG43_07090 [Acidobacteria bacterium]|nr:MAG: hypothetical protein DMG43_07090 [Acidobacteriota bacterium]
MRDLLIFANERAPRQSALVSTAPAATPSFRTERADVFSFRFAPAKRSAFVARNLSVRCNA